MITPTNLPKSYKPYNELNVCSNILKEGGHLLVLSGVLPLVVGRGDTPLIWLNGPADRLAKNFMQLVAASVSTHPVVNVRCDPTGISVFVERECILRVTETDQERAVIDLLDFRPIGINVFGDSLSLNAGGNTFRRNTYIGTGALLAFGV